MARTRYTSRLNWKKQETIDKTSKADSSKPPARKNYQLPKKKDQDGQESKGMEVSQL